MKQLHCLFWYIACLTRHTLQTVFCVTRQIITYFEMKRAMVNSNATRIKNMPSNICKSINQNRETKINNYNKIPGYIFINDCYRRDV